jgi:hypothetical protein
MDYVVEEIEGMKLLQAAIEARAALGWEVVSVTASAGGDGVFVVVYKKPKP